MALCDCVIVNSIIWIVSLDVGIRGPVCSNACRANNSRAIGSVTMSKGESHSQATCLIEVSNVHIVGDLHYTSTKGITNIPLENVVQ